MEYLNQVLGIRVVYKEEPVTSMPNYIYARYRLLRVTLDGKAVIFVYPKEEIEAVSAVKKHISRIAKTEKVPAVLILEHLTYRQKEYLLRDHIPFVVEGRQIYLPFMAVYLQERTDGEKQNTKEILPSAQLLLLYYIYHGCGEMMTSEASQKLGFTATSVSRASRQLEDLGLIKTQKRGVQKIIYTDKTPRELFEDVKGSLSNPVKRTIYVPKAELDLLLPMSGYSALSEYTMINPPMTECFAAWSIAAWEKAGSSKLQSTDEQCAIELWRYDPRKLSTGTCVDKLSLALSLREDRDERIEEAEEEMLKSVWEK